MTNMANNNNVSNNKKKLFVDKNITIIIVIANFTEQILITKLFLGALDMIYFIPSNNS